MGTKLDKEEKDILDSYERGEWKTLNPSRKERAKYQQYARATLTKDKRVNIRISSKVLEDLQLKAIEEGIPYQTLISSVLYKFATGRLIDRALHKRLQRTRK